MHELPPAGGAVMRRYMGLATLALILVAVELALGQAPSESSAPIILPSGAQLLPPIEAPVVTSVPDVRGMVPVPPITRESAATIMVVDQDTKAPSEPAAKDGAAAMKKGLEELKKGME